MNGMSRAKKAKAVQKSKLPDWAKEGYVPPYQDGPVLKDSNPTARLTRTVTKVERPSPWGMETVITGKKSKKVIR